MIQEEDDTSAEGQRSGIEVTGSGDTEENMKEEVISFGVNCSECNSPAKTNMKVVGILCYDVMINNVCLLVLRFIRFVVKLAKSMQFLSMVYEIVSFSPISINSLVKIECA